MTENEVLIKTPEEAIETIKSNMPTSGYQMLRESLDMAIIALKEVQQYREIGTVEECKELAYIVNIAEKEELAKIIDEYLLYSKIGTVEECREAVEKQKPKAPKDSLKIKPVIDENGAYVDADTTIYLLCPNCGEMVGIEDNCDRFCHECGQAIDNENLEGMEDEGKAI